MWKFPILTEENTFDVSCVWLFFQSIQLQFAHDAAVSNDCVQSEKFGRQKSVSKSFMLLLPSSMFLCHKPLQWKSFHPEMFMWGHLWTFLFVLPHDRNALVLKNIQTLWTLLPTSHAVPRPKSKNKLPFCAHLIINIKQTMFVFFFTFFEGQKSFCTLVLSTTA